MKKVNHINQKKENNQLKEENPHYEIFQNDSFGNSNSQYYNYKNDNNNLNIINRNNIFINDIDTKLEITLNYLDLNELNDIFITNNISFKDMLILSKNDMIDLGFNLVQRNRFRGISFGFGDRQPLYPRNGFPGPGSYNIPGNFDRGLKGKLPLN